MANFASITVIPCSCGFLQRCAENPDLPIVFDRLTNEFHIEYPSIRGGKGQLIIHHCMSCGGAAPDSMRDTLFATVSMDEVLRLKDMFGRINTLKEAIEKFGPPDHDFPGGLMTTKAETDANLPITDIYRTIIYENVSEIALVHLTDYHRESIGISFRGKYIGPKNT